MKKWNEYYANNIFPLGVECVKCKKWRLVDNYKEKSEVPDNWDCSMWKMNKKQGSCDIPSNVTENDFVEEEFVPGSIIWAKFGRYPWWPGMVEDCPDSGEYFESGVEGKKYHITFFGGKPLRNWIPDIKVVDFSKPSPVKSNKRKVCKDLDRAIIEAEKAIKMPQKKRLETYSFGVVYKGRWGMSNKANAPIPKPEKSVMKEKEVIAPTPKPEKSLMKEKEVKEKIKRGRPKVDKDSEPIKRGRKKSKVDMDFDSKIPKVNASENATVLNSSEAQAGLDKNSNEVEMSVAADDSKVMDENNAGTSSEVVIPTSDEYDSEEEIPVSPVVYTEDEILYLNALRMYYQGAPSRTLKKLKPYEYHDYFENLVKEVEESKKSAKNNPFFCPHVSGVGKSQIHHNHEDTLT